MGFNKLSARICGKKSSRKGIKSRKTVVIEAFIKNIVNKDTIRKKYVTELKSIDGKQFLDTFRDLLEYVLPKLRRTEMIAEVKTEITKKINLSKLSKEELKKLNELIARSTAT